MSCRSDGSINVQLLAEKLGGGGHFSSAAVSFNKADAEEVKRDLLTILNKHLKAAMSTNGKPGEEED